MTDRAAAPDPSSTQASGWVEAGLYVLCIALLGSAYAAATARGAHVAVFILYSLVISAVAMLAWTGPGRNAWAIITHPASWLVGIANMAVEGGYALLISDVTPAEGSLMIRLSIPITLLIGVVVFGRRPRPIVWLGAAIVAAVVIVLLAGVGGDRRNVVLASAMAGGLAIGVRAFASEFHKWNRLAVTVTEKIQVTALVTLVTAITGLLVLGAFMLAVHYGLLPPMPLLPEPGALVHLPTLVSALLVGGALFTAMTYLSFSSVLKIRSENFIASSAFMPLATLMVQMPAAALGLITLPAFDWRLLPAMLAAIAGVLLMIFGGRKA